MWRNDRVKMIARDCSIDSRASSVGRMTSRSDVVRVVRITDELFREQEHVLIIVNELLRTVCVVERDQVCKRSHVRLAQRLQIVRDLRPEFVEQRGEFIAGVGKYVTGVSINNFSAEAVHHIKRVVCERNRLLVARDAASEITVIEKAHVAADAFTSQRTTLEQWRVI